MRWYLSLILSLGTVGFASSSARADTYVMPPTVTVNGAIFSVFDAKSAGTGNINSFLRIQENGMESGYNTGFPKNNFPAGFPDFDQKKGSFTYNISLGEVPKNNILGVDYRTFLLDLNEPNGQGNDKINLEELKVFVGPSANVFLGGNLGLLVNNGPLGALIYDLDNPAGPNSADNRVVLTDMFSGSGTTDVAINIPDSFFNGKGAAEYVYLWAKFSDSEGGFEEFVTQGPAGGPGPGGNPTPGPDPNVVPEPTSVAIWSLAGLAGWMGRRSRRRRR